MVKLKGGKYKFFERHSLYTERVIEKTVGYKDTLGADGLPEQIIETHTKQVRSRCWVGHVLMKDEVNEKGRAVPGTQIHYTQKYRRKNQAIRELRKEGLI